ncbi:hypothetical protein [Parasphingorhabdus halotolerans]|uniref:Uncharacterized protein n=1 Tax=Parasphingorhabdus halotolerans TaxID=2725558 RepID=A0A6H2DM01_9SPHN|nr:hypothetical protein [Parasphingorhabdus halotolerans]QJB69702.1 hypothetical protein HF685_10780 [Parasphingorhabdus halotolerans]
MSTMLLFLMSLSGTPDAANPVPRGSARAHVEVSARIISGEAVRARADGELRRPNMTSSDRPYMELPIAQSRTKVASGSSDAADEMLVEFY